MKICILGPVETKTCMGGVAIFDIGLARAFNEERCDVFIATDQKDAVEDLNVAVPVYNLNKTNFRKLLKQKAPDYIITELAYAKYLLHVKTSAVKIYYLHSFFKQSYYGVLKSRLATIYQKRLIKKCDLVFSNSYFTEMINHDMFGIDSDAVFHVGVTDLFLNDAAKYADVSKERHSVFFAGRLIPAKGVDRIIEAVNLLKEKGINIKLYIAGEGKEKEKLLDAATKYNLNVKYLGRLSQLDIVKRYAESEVFISLDASEPFGIVFAEALISNCKIVCPITGGQIEFLNKYRDSVAYVNLRSAQSIADGIEEIITNGKAPALTEEQKATFTYRNSAKNILNYLRKYNDSKEKQ